MIFAFSPGSEGIGPERYVVSIPFTVAPGRVLNKSANPIIQKMGASTVKLEKLHHLHYLTFGPYATLQRAETGLGNVAAALLWTSLNQEVGIQYAKERKDPIILPDPSPINESGAMGYMLKSPGWEATDGNYDAEYSTVRPDHKRLVRWEAGHVNLTVGVDANRFVAIVGEALQFPGLGAVAADEKLKLAIELYAGHRFELSTSAQFIALVTTLEALLPDLIVSESTSEAIERASEAVLVARNLRARETQEWTDIDRLLSRVGELKRESIGASLRQFVGAAIARNPALGEEQTVLGSLRDAYSTRSRLLHDGSADPQALSAGLTFLRDFVPRLLIALFKEVSGAKGEKPAANAPQRLRLDRAKPRSEPFVGRAPASRADRSSGSDRK